MGGFDAAGNRSARCRACSRGASTTNGIFAPPGGESYRESRSGSAAWYATLTRDTVVAAHGGGARALMANFHMSAGGGGDARAYRARRRLCVCRRHDGALRVERRRNLGRRNLARKNESGRTLVQPLCEAPCRRLAKTEVTARPQYEAALTSFTSSSSWPFSSSSPLSASLVFVLNLGRVEFKLFRRCLGPLGLRPLTDK